ncbi:hypothetical protein BC829DRAFT_281441 [Chytridium lagenaria]|nr:hypothetical protein BC829DRAFT_281441 [Chytridium lagenaria]
MKSRLEISEATRKAVHENTIAILRQTQEDSASLAITHQERALAMLREESKAQATANFDSELRRLRSEVADAKIEISRWKAKAENAFVKQEAAAAAEERENLLKAAEERVKALEVRLAEISKEKEAVEIELVKARASWPPERRRFEEVEVALQKSEEGFKKREGELQKIVESVQKSSEDEVERVKAKYAGLIRRKDDEIRYFKVEMDGLLDGLEELRRLQERELFLS